MSFSTPFTDDNRADNTRLLLAEGAAALGIDLDERQLRLLAAYAEELLKWNRIVSLVAVKSPLDIPIKHFLDSLTVLPLLPSPGGRLLDIGTGGGFPGLPLKIARPELDLYLLETARKKVSFLKETTRVLGLTGVTVVHGRVERVMKTGSMAASCDTVISRAAFQPPELLAMGAHFLRPGGLLVIMRGPREGADAAMREVLAVQTGLRLERKALLRLPVTGERRIIYLYRKPPAEG